MKFTTAVLSTLLGFSATSLAQFNVSSRPFQLIARNHDQKYNNSAFTACHEGAAIEGLCILPSNETNVEYSTYHFNTSSTYTGFNTSVGAEGLLVFSLPTSSGVSFSEPLSLYTPFSTNVGLALFEPGYSYFYVTFTKDNQLVVQVSYDDTQKPAPKDVIPPHVYNRWYICNVNYEGYIYETLNWVYGGEAPNNPTCVKTSVYRKFL